MIDRVDETGAADAPDLRKPRRKKQNHVDLSKLDRLPPHSIEAEQGVMGCILISPNECLGDCIQNFKPGAAVFYDLRHQTLYSQLVEMWDAKQPIDIITIQQRLKDKNLIESIGGLPYLASLLDAVPSAANLSYYSEIVLDKFILRKMLKTCTEGIGRIYESEDEVATLIDELEKEVLGVRGDRDVKGSLHIKDLVFKTIEKIEELHSRNGALTGIGTGLLDFDKMTSGLQPGEMIVIAARPSMGKTSLAMNMVEHVIFEQKYPVGVFSLEMTAESLVMRTVCSRARVNHRNIVDGFLTERDFRKITETAGKLANAPLYIDDTPGLSILQLRAKARRMSLQHGIKLFVVDYLQLLHSTSRRAENRQQEIADISNGLKALAKELKVPVIVLSQLNREMEKDKNRKPRLSDLRESGAIEQDADLVGLLYKPEVKEDDDGAPEESVAVNLYIAKQRNGPTGDVRLTFMKSYTRFESAARVNPEDVPAE